MERPQPIRPEGVFEGLRPRAIARGFLWDLALSMASMFVIASFLLEDGLLNSSDEELDAVFASTRFYLLALPVGLGCTAFGGYLAGSRAGTHPVKNGIAVGVAEIVLALVASLVPSKGPAAPWWYDLIGYALILPAAAVGGVLARARVGTEAR